MVETVVASDKWRALKEKTPLGHLPVLRHGEERIPDSVAILQYVAGQLGFSSFAAGSAARMTALALAVEDLRTAVSPHKTARNYEGAKELLKNQAVYLERWLNGEKTKKYLVDDRLTYADVTVYDQYEQVLNDFIKVDDAEATIRTDFAAPLLADLFASVRDQLSVPPKGDRRSEL